MDLRLIKYFVSTAEAGSATAAARALHVTQPVLSRQLRHLEQQLGLHLFDREGRRLRLSRAGEAFLPTAQELLRHAANAAGAAHNLAAGVVTEVHIAAPPSTLTDVVAPFIATLGPTEPVPLVRDIGGESAQAALAAGADLAVVTTRPARSLGSRALMVCPVWAYVAPDDPWAGRSSVDVSELPERTLIVLQPQFQPRALLDAALNSTGPGYGDVIEVGNTQVAQAIAATGRGVAVVSDDARFDLVPLLISVPGGYLQIRLFAAWERQHHAAVLLEDWADRLGAFCLHRYGPGLAAEGIS
ncbi:LysR family transcriptional regulator [Nocardioides sp.]|uniref:LysR family transcriptional regulator n=1 Tax=Nocardioides sp. TaxID=35761 RepID=UPI00263985D8|nr:LysR family transcriptional regulator [Nocardioides sp.]